MAESRLACRECHHINHGDAQACENCGSSSLTEDWAGYVVISHPDGRRIAEELTLPEPAGSARKVG